MAVRLAALLIALAACAVAPGAAGACSFAPFDYRQALADADGAVIGSVESRAEPNPGVEARLGIRVERALKGDLPPVIEIATHAQGSACGVEARVGTRVALLLHRGEDGALRASLADQLRERDLLAAAAPLPKPSGRGGPALLVGVRLGPNRLLALDRDGRPLGYGRGVGHVYAIDACPGGRFAVESVADGAGRSWLAVRDLRTMASRRLVATRGIATELACRTRGAGVVDLIGVGGGDARAFRAVGGRLKLVARAPGRMAVLGGWRMFAAGGPGAAVVAVDLRSGRRATLGRVDGELFGLVPAPDGSRVAVLPGWVDDEVDWSVILLGDDGATVIESTRPIQTTGRHAVAWTAAGQLVRLRSGSGDAVVSTLDGRRAGRVAGFRASSVLARGGRLYAVEQGDLLVGRLASGTTARLRLPGPVVDVTAVVATG